MPSCPLSRRRALFQGSVALLVGTGALFLHSAARAQTLTAQILTAQTLTAPAGRPILTITGKIARTTKPDAAEFDRPALEALGMTKIVTETPWYKGPVTFEGVPIAKILAAVGATGTRLMVTALNDYTAELPVEDAMTRNVILALKRDGEYMTVRDKGPLFVVYPYDSDPELKSQKYYSRSVWQVAKIDVK